nr:MAG TPA: hypothetical protein [Caudoviricetes sp.]
MISLSVIVTILLTEEIYKLMNSESLLIIVMIC